MCHVNVYVRKLPKGVDGVFDELLEKYVKGDDTYRNARLKYLARVREGAPAALQRVMAWARIEKPVLMGKGKLDQWHYSGPNYVEVDVDINSSKVAKRACGQIMAQFYKLVVDEMFVIEGQSDDELPERPLGVCRYCHVDMESNLEIVADEDFIDIDK